MFKIMINLQFNYSADYRFGREIKHPKFLKVGAFGCWGLFLLGLPAGRQVVSLLDCFALQSSRKQKVKGMLFFRFKFFNLFFKIRINLLSFIKFIIFKKSFLLCFYVRNFSFSVQNFIFIKLQKFIYRFC